ncbi:MAG: hypothetical protein NTY01_18240 [Verrucomicrobia bacterium]|nr:hypothetical protein [Verrucomicrobiota bacterium]
MTAPLPAAIAVRELHGGGARYELPRRSLGLLRFVGLLPLGFGVFFSLFAVVWMAMAASGGGWFGWLFALWGLPFFFAGCAPMAMGLFILAGRCGVELRGGALRVTERAGPFRWTRRQPVDAITRFNVRVADASSATALGFLGSLAALDADCGKPKPFLIAIGYPREWLQALGDDLARRCNLATPGRVLAPQKLTVETVAEPLRPPQPLAQEENLNQPAGSNVTLEPQADGFALHVPPTGVWRSNKFLLIFGAFWCAFCALITGLTIGTKDNTILFAMLFLALFWAIGIGMVFVAVKSGRCRATIHATGDRLRIAYVGVFRAQTREWLRDEIAAICAGPSGIEVNDRPVIELQIHPRTGGKLGLLAGRDVAELQWIAAVLRQAFGASSEPPTATGGPRRTG